MTQQTSPSRSRALYVLAGWMVSMCIGIALGGCADDYSGAAPTTTGPSLVEQIQNREEFQDLLDSTDQTVLVVEFYADWCYPCRKVSPVLESIARTAPPHLKIVKVDIDDNRPLADRYKVRGIPTVVVIQEQKMVGSLLGVHPKRKYLEMIQKASPG